MDMTDTCITRGGLDQNHVMHLQLSTYVHAITYLPPKKVFRKNILHGLYGGG